MKEKVIETAGKTWRFLGQNGETNVAQLPRLLRENNTVVLQALGWLAREDKINYTIRSRRTFVSLVEREVGAFNDLIYKMGSLPTELEVQKQQGRAKNKLKSR
ncbi:MAG: winged helix-turn-helix domain-containing protein [Candidatus Omnitrophica bacterium]|nr:winged helix-turn-helix domain-containing protein [Candidatus Omnitrophota bacterium]